MGEVISMPSIFTGLGAMGAGGGASPADGAAGAGA